MKSQPRFRNGLVAVALAFASTGAPAAPGDLYMAEPTGGGHIYRFSPSGDQTTFASGLYQPVALAFDPAGNLFVGDSGAGIPAPMPSKVYKFTPDGTQSLFATISSTQLLGMAFDGAGNLFVSTGESIVKLSPDGTQSTFASGLGAWPLVFDTLGNLYVGDNQIGPASILKFAPDGSRSTFVTFPNASITALAFDHSGNLFVRSSGEIGILRITPAGTVTPFASGNFRALAFAADGVLFAGLLAFDVEEPAVVKFTPDGMRTTFLSGFFLPRALAFEPVTEKLRNLSARGLVGLGDHVLIGGFILGGNALANNAVIARAIGPSLADSGVPDPLADPVLELHNGSGQIVASNNDWQDSQEAIIRAHGLAPTNARESAIYATLPAGGYTVVVRGLGNTTGVALVEVYSVND
jgi:hypothetical protein